MAVGLVRNGDQKVVLRERDLGKSHTLFFKSDVLSSFAPSGSQSRGSTTTTTTLTSPLEMRSRHR
jgi:hypothetical protein